MKNGDGKKILKVILWNWRGCDESSLEQAVSEAKNLSTGKATWKEC